MPRRASAAIACVSAALSSAWLPLRPAAPDPALLP